MPRKFRQKVVYEIRCPETDRIMYVGATTDPISRFAHHIAPSRINLLKRNELALWIKEIRSKGLKPVFKKVIIFPDSVTKKELREAEKLHTIEVNKHTKTFNKFIGSSHTQITKQWVVDGNKKRKLSEKSKLKSSISNSKYKFICDDEEIYGLVKLSEKTGIGITTLLYRINAKKELSNKNNISIICQK